MLWIALHLPALSLESFAATLGAVRHALPLALLDAQRIAAVNRVALQLGVKPGLKRATALALAPQLCLGQADAARDAQALHALAHAALAFTPMVTLAAEAALPCVLLEVQGSLRYFGGLPALQQRLRAALAPLGFSLRMASAPTALGAALLARWRGGFELGAHVDHLGTLQERLDDAPVWLLGPGREHGGTLQGMGLRTLGELRRLPRTGLARRFGEALLTELDRARGEAPDPREAIVPAPTFEARLELYERADSTEQVLQGAQVLLVRLLAWAQAQHARIGSFTLAMRHDRCRGDTATPAHTELPIALAEASNDIQQLQWLLRERLGRLPLPAPTLELRLRCSQLQHSAAPNGELFPSAASAQQGLVRLIERLQARLGPEQVQQPVLCEDHRPERGTAWQPALPDAGARAGARARSAGAERGVAGLALAGLGRAAGTRTPLVAGAASPVPAAASPLTRPVWLLPQPLALPERQSRPLLDGRPLQLLAGPERIECGWWDGAPAARDYFIAQVHDGALVWVYRARLPLAQPAGEGWFLHGRFG
ncbi:MAG TPA: DNA polymerase Y family protein [Rubrivivax sp.]|nr:DNA polymerase Y family protein [Rubrivivax sp.]